MSYDRGEPGTWCWFTPESGLPSIPVTDLRVHPATNGVYPPCPSRLLLGVDWQVMPIRAPLRRIGVVIKQPKEEPRAPGRTEDAGMPAGS